MRKNTLGLIILARLALPLVTVVSSCCYTGGCLYDECYDDPMDSDGDGDVDDDDIDDMLSAMDLEKLYNCATIPYAGFGLYGESWKLEVYIDISACAVEDVEGVLIWDNVSFEDEMYFTVEDTEYDFDDANDLILATGLDAWYLFPYPPASGYAPVVIPFVDVTALGLFEVRVLCENDEQYDCPVEVCSYDSFGQAECTEDVKY